MTNFVPKIILGILVLTALVGILFAGGNDLNLKIVRTDENFRGDGVILDITNVGQKQVRIVSIVFNERDDCPPLAYAAMPFKARDLKVGDGLRVYSICRIIRATLKTSEGSETYSFN